MSRKNNWFRLSFYLVVCILAFTISSIANAQQALPNGGMISSAISVVGEVDEYTFDAVAGDTVSLRVADTETTEFINSAFAPGITLVDPGGAVVISNTGNLVAHIDDRALVQTGTYTVLVRDDSFSEDETGSYDIFFVRAPGANDDGVLPNGGVLPGTIDLGDIDSYTFDANAGDTVSLRVADTETTEFIDSAFAPNVTLLDPSGSVVINNTGNLVAHIDDRALIQTGTYTVLVRDDSFSDEATGSYDIFFARAPGANDDGVLPNGGVLSGNIDLGDIDSYTFDANAGDTVSLRVADTETTEFINSAFAPNVTLLDPSGSVVISNTGNLVAHIDDRALILTGTYTVLVRDDSFSDEATGSYDIFFARAPGASDDGVLPNGGVLPGNIALGEIDSYNFNANSGDTVSLRVADTETTEFINSAFAPNVTLLDPSGSVVISNTGNLVAHIDDRALDETGTYTVLVRDDSFSDEAIGSYNIYFARAPGANADGCVANGQTTTGFIDLGDIDSYSFSANAGISIQIVVTDLDSAAFAPNIRLFSPSGSSLSSSTDNTVAEIDTTLVETGEYTLLIRDGSFSDDATGNYQLAIFGASVSCPDPFCNGLPVDVFIGAGDLPTSGDDVILGTSGADTINSRGGNDTICSLSGSDIINSGGGNDWIDGGSGDDNIQGSAGNDTIFGDLGSDVIRGGGGDDDINGEEGDDSLLGQSGDDTIDGGTGIDEINGGGGNDTIFTGPGATVGSGVFVSGSGGNDTINGGPDADDIKGSTGEDIINGFSGDDEITGGNGRDVIDGGDGNDTIQGQESRDTISGGAGNDDINGGPENDTINGGSGNDDLNGGPGNDIVRGDSGSDNVLGGSGDDTLVGGPSGGDFCNGQTGIDTAAASCESTSRVP